MELPKPNFAGFAARPDVTALIRRLSADPQTPPPPSPSKPIAAESVGLRSAIALAHRESVKPRYFYDLTGTSRAMDQIRELPAPGESLHCVMGGEYHGFDIVVAVQRLAAAIVADLHITTLGFNRHNMSHLCGMIDAGQILRATILCADYFAASDAQTYLYARQELTSRGARIAATRNHSKIILLAIGSDRYVVESSANLRSCNNVEQFTLTHSPALYDFHRAWIERIHAHLETLPADHA